MRWDPLVSRGQTLQAAGAALISQQPACLHLVWLTCDGIVRGKNVLGLLSVWGERLGRREALSANHTVPVSAAAAPQEVLPRATRDGRRNVEECDWWYKTLAPDVSPAFSLEPSPAPDISNATQGASPSPRPSSPNATTGTSPSPSPSPGPSANTTQNSSSPSPLPSPAAKAASPAQAAAAPMNAVDFTFRPIPIIAIRTSENSTSGFPPPGGVATGAVSTGRAAQLAAFAQAAAAAATSGGGGSNAAAFASASAGGDGSSSSASAIASADSSDANRSG